MRKCLVKKGRGKREGVCRGLGETHHSSLVYWDLTTGAGNKMGKGSPLKFFCSGGELGEKKREGKKKRKKLDAT